MTRDQRVNYGDRFGRLVISTTHKIANRRRKGLPPEEIFREICS